MSSADETSRSHELQALDRLRDENVRLVHRLTRLRLALEKVAAENAALRRRLAQVKRKNGTLKAPDRRASTPQEHAERVRSMLRSRASRNP